MKLNPEKLVQLEIISSDLDASVQFYREAFGWPPVPAEMHDMVVLDVGDLCPYGISIRTKLSVPLGSSRIIPYFESSDPQEIYETVENYGGTKKSGPISLPSYGQVWFVADPDGQTIGLFKKR